MNDGINYVPTRQSFSYICDWCGASVDLIRFTVTKGEPFLGQRLVSVRTEVREIVEHVCEGGTG